MSLLAIVPSAVLFRIRGGGIIDQTKRKIPRLVYLLGMGILIALTADTFLYAAAMALVVVIIGCMPTKPLLDVTHPGSSIRAALEDGAIRALPAMPAALVNPWVLVFLLHGLVYYYAGKQTYMPQVTLSELIVGAVIGAIL